MVVEIHINNKNFKIRITEEICECSYVKKERYMSEGIKLEEESNDEDSNSFFIPPLMATLEDE